MWAVVHTHRGRVVNVDGPYETREDAREIKRLRYHTHGRQHTVVKMTREVTKREFEEVITRHIRGR